MMHKLSALLLFFASVAAGADDLPTPLLETYPQRIEARIELRDHQLRRAAPRGVAGATLEQVVSTVRRWSPGQKVTVAFFGGGPTLYANIEAAAREWTQGDRANLQLEFRDPTTQNFRQWSPSDVTFTANIRVSFDQEGYWSYVGTDSINEAVVKPGESSLNLQSFNVELPMDWRAVVRHEFGHALGFYHEHQHPDDPCDFRWEDDAGYVATVDRIGQYIVDRQGRRPGVYTVLGGPPNNWPRWKVDANLRSLTSSRMLDTSPFDNSSIMKYVFPSWMFVEGQSSHCFSARENEELSPGDIAAARRAYPRSAEDIARIKALQFQYVTSLVQAGALRGDAMLAMENVLWRSQV